MTDINHNHKKILNFPRKTVQWITHPQTQTRNHTKVIKAPAKLHEISVTYVTKNTNFWYIINTQMLTFPKKTVQWISHPQTQTRYHTKVIKAPAKLHVISVTYVTKTWTFDISLTHKCSPSLKKQSNEYLFPKHKPETTQKWLRILLSYTKSVLHM